MKARDLGQHKYGYHVDWEKMEYYDAIAKGYDGLYKEEQLKKLMRISLHIPPGATILDVGCGTGISKVLGNVMGIDPSRKLLECAAIPVIVGVAECLPFKNESFDAVISITALHHCENIKEAIAEIKRVSKGIIGLSILKKSKKFLKLEKEIKAQFIIRKRIEESIDVIFICGKLPLKNRQSL